MAKYYQPDFIWSFSEEYLLSAIRSILSNGPRYSDEPSWCNADRADRLKALFPLPAEPTSNASEAAKRGDRFFPTAPYTPRGNMKNGPLPPPLYWRDEGGAEHSYPVSSSANPSPPLVRTIFPYYSNVTIDSLEIVRGDETARLDVKQIVANHKGGRSSRRIWTAERGTPELSQQFYLDSYMIVRGSAKFFGDQALAANHFDTDVPNDPSVLSIDFSNSPLCFSISAAPGLYQDTVKDLYSGPTPQRTRVGELQDDWKFDEYPVNRPGTRYRSIDLLFRLIRTPQGSNPIASLAWNANQNNMWFMNWLSSYEAATKSSYPTLLIRPDETGFRYSIYLRESEFTRSHAFYGASAIPRMPFNSGVATLIDKGRKTLQIACDLDRPSDAVEWHLRWDGFFSPEKRELLPPGADGAWPRCDQVPSGNTKGFAVSANNCNYIGNRYDTGFFVSSNVLLDAWDGLLNLIPIADVPIPDKNFRVMTLRIANPQGPGIASPDIVWGDWGVRIVYTAYFTALDPNEAGEFGWVRLGTVVLELYYWGLLESAYWGIANIYRTFTFWPDVFGWFFQPPTEPPPPGPISPLQLHEAVRVAIKKIDFEKMVFSQTLILPEQLWRCMAPPDGGPGEGGSKNIDTRGYQMCFSALMDVDWYVGSNIMNAGTISGHGIQLYGTNLLPTAYLKSDLGKLVVLGHQGFIPIAGKKCDRNPRDTLILENVGSRPLTVFSIRVLGLPQNVPKGLFTISRRLPNGGVDPMPFPLVMPPKSVATFQIDGHFLEAGIAGPLKDLRILVLSSVRSASFYPAQAPRLFSVDDLPRECRVDPSVARVVPLDKVDVPFPRGFSDLGGHGVGPRPFGSPGLMRTAIPALAPANQGVMSQSRSSQPSVGSMPHPSSYEAKGTEHWGEAGHTVGLQPGLGDASPAAEATTESDVLAPTQVVKPCGCRSPAGRGE